MILIALSLAFAQSPAAEPVDQEIVVIGERLKTWRGNFRTRNGKFSCKITKSTGDAAIDAIGCDAMTVCWPDAQPKFDASVAKGLTKDERARLQKVAFDAFGECVVPRRKAGIAALAERRATARGL